LRRVGVRDAIEVTRIHERGDERAALRSRIAILDGKRDVPDVPVEGIAVEQQEKRRHEDDRRQGAAIAQDLAQFLPVNREGFTHATFSDALSITSRKTSSSDGATAA